MHFPLRPHLPVFAAATLLLAIHGAHAGTPKSCPSTTPLSCHNTTAVTDTCCVASPGGLLLQTQFWDAAQPVPGPSTSWTVHGLWPDNCNGGYQSNCDASRAYTNITQILQAYGATALLGYMQTYWTDYEGDNESFWEHEWAKHGTCISTFDTACYTDYAPQQEVVDFFNDTVALYRTLPTYAWLADADIVPSTSRTYTSAAVLKALNTPRGVNPYISCSGNNLNEVWYFYYLQGSVQGGKFQATDASVAGSINNCPATLTYLPKTSTTATATASKTLTTLTTTTSTTTKTTATPTPSSSAGAFIGKGYLTIQSSGSTNGCLISNGKWYTTGTCATITGVTSSSSSNGGVTLSSSKGNCGIVSGVFSCASTITSPTVFGVSVDMLTYGTSTTFYASAVPSGSTQASVETAKDAITLQILWEAS